MLKKCVLRKNVNTADWLKNTAVRCVRTFATTMVAILPTTAATLGSVNWEVAFSTAALAAVTIFFVCMAGIPEVEEKPVEKTE